MASITVCDRCGEQQPISQRDWYAMTFTDNNRNPAEPAWRYDLCSLCAKALAEKEDWLFT